MLSAIIIGWVAPLLLCILLSFFLKIERVKWLGVIPVFNIFILATAIVYFVSGVVKYFQEAKE